MKRGFFVFLTITVIYLLAGASPILAALRYGESKGESIPCISGDGPNYLQGCDEVSDGKDCSGEGASFRMYPDGLSGILFCRATGRFSISGDVA
ncbi:MAG: hypothetical protein WBC88_11255, partial [Candidatus Zixiibacteriota bacterium]